MTVRPMKSVCLRLFISIRTMKSVIPEEKVCDACRTTYYVWKNNNAEFGNLFSRIEEELPNVEEVIYIDSVEEKVFLYWIYADT